jgi:hypothetical protein
MQPRGEARVSQPDVRTVAEFRQETAALAQDDFVACYEHPFLVRGRDLAANQVEATSLPAQFRTSVMRIPTAKELAASKEMRSSVREVGSWPVYVVRKQARSVFSGRISIGRTATNDIRLDGQEISKFHAYFTWDDDRSAYYLSDAGTTNGTRVNHDLIPSGERTKLVDGDVIHIGPCTLYYYSPAGFYAYLKSL